jgi:flagellar motor component MotA
MADEVKHELAAILSATLEGIAASFTVFFPIIETIKKLNRYLIS